MINNPIWPVSELICKFQETSIKPECIMLMTKLKHRLFSNQGDVTLRLMIRSGQLFNSSKIPSMATLSAMFVAP